MTVTVQVIVTSSPAVAAISDWSNVTLGGGISGGGGGMYMSVHVCMGSPLQLPVSSSVCVTVGLVAGSTNGVLSTGVIVDTQSYTTPSSEGNRKLNSAIPWKGDSQVVILVLLVSLVKFS